VRETEIRLFLNIDLDLNLNLGLDNKLLCLQQDLNLISTST
jgi:hypothetical protein